MLRLSTTLVLLLVSATLYVSAVLFPNYGKSFFFAAPSSHIEMRIVVSNSKQFDIYVTLKFGSDTLIRKTMLPPETDREFTVPTALANSGSGITQSVIFVKASSAVYVRGYMFSRNSDRRAECLFYPHSSLGNEYYPITEGCIGMRFIMIIPTINVTARIYFPNSHVSNYFKSITPPFTFNDTNMMLEDFSQNSVLRLESPFSLTGTRIETNEKVAVVSGCDSFSDIYDIIYDQVPAAHLVGRDYVIPPYKEGGTEYIYVVTKNSTTTAVLETRDACADLTLQRGLGNTIVLSNMSKLLSEDPITVAHFVRSNLGNRVSMHYVTPLEQATDSYVIFTHTSTSVNVSYDLVLYMDTNAISSCTYDNLAISTLPWVTTYTTLLSDVTKVVIENVVPNVHHDLQSTNNKINGFMVSVAGGNDEVSTSSIGFNRTMTIKESCVGAQTPSLDGCALLQRSCPDISTTSASTVSGRGFSTSDSATTESRTGFPATSNEGALSIGLPDCCGTEGCNCTCYYDDQFNNTAIELEQKLQKLRKELLLDRKKLSSTLRRKTSADDPRPSSTRMGYLGATVIVVVLGGIIAADLSLLAFEFKSVFMALF